MNGSRPGAAPGLAQFPPQLSRAIERETARHDLQALSRAAAELSAQYRAGRPGAFIASELHRLAYLAARLPATFAAARAVLGEVRRLMPDRPITSLLDLGVGPGTASWAAAQVFVELRRLTLVERDEGWLRLGKALAGENPLLENAAWVQADLRAAELFPAHDLVVGSYALGELGPEKARRLVQAAWSAARVALVLVEPGTMSGFALIRLLRAQLIELGGQLIAPCPHRDACPLAAGDWCHFSQRAGRSPLHRRLKAGALGYEDEKFSYVAAAKDPVRPARARVLRHPLRHAGHVQFRLCARDGIQTLTVARSDKERWKQARKAAWGDEWPIPPGPGCGAGPG